MIDLGVFSIGLSIGATIMFVIRLYPEWRQYVAFALCPAPAQCPHHRDLYVKRVNANNDQSRRGPTRPDIH